MKSKSFILIAAALFLGGSSIFMSSCRKSADDTVVEHPDVDDADIDPVDFQHGANAISVQQLDQLILMPDDLTPGQAVGALKMLDDQIRGSQGAKRDETMRKFVDLYGIMLDIHGDNMRKAFKRLKERSGVDLETIYGDYSTTLIVGDEAGGGDMEEEMPQAEISTVNDQPSEQSADQPAAEPKPESSSAPSEPQSTSAEV